MQKQKCAKAARGGDTAEDSTVVAVAAANGSGGMAERERLEREYDEQVDRSAKERRRRGVTEAWM